MLRDILAIKKFSRLQAAQQAELESLQLLVKLDTLHFLICVNYNTLNNILPRCTIYYTISRVMLNYLKATAVFCKRLVKVCYKLPLYKRLAQDSFCNYSSAAL